MLFYKCCQFLMRMMSPPVAGLILIFLIGGLSEIIPTQPPYHFTRRSKLISTFTTPSLPFSSPRDIFNNEHSRSPKLKPLPDSTFVPQTTHKDHTISNKTDGNTTRKNVLKFRNRNPKLSRRLVKESSVKDVREPWKTPPEERQLNKILINPKGIRKFTTTVRSSLNPRTVSSLEYLLNSLLRNKSYRITLSVDGSKKDNYFVRLFEKLPNSNSSNPTIDNLTTDKTISEVKLENGTKFQNPTTMFSRKSLVTNMYLRDFTRKPKIKLSNKTNASILDIREYLTTPNSKTETIYAVATSDPFTDVSHFVSSTPPSIIESQTRKNRRSGRLFPIAEDLKLIDKKERNHTGGIETLFPNRTILARLTEKAKEFNDLFNYTYQISALERGSVFPHDPLEDTDKEFGKRSSFISPYIIPYLEKQSSSEIVETVTKNTSVYNSLRPRLRTTKSSLYKTTYGQRAYTNPASITRQNQDIGTTPRSKLRVKMLLSETRHTRPASIEFDANTTVISNNRNNTEELKLDTSIVIPKQSDTISPRMFERRPRNHTRVVPQRSSLGRKASTTTMGSDIIRLRETLQGRNNTENLTKQYTYSIGKSRQLRPFSNRSTLMPKLRTNTSESTLLEINEVITSPTIISETVLRKISENLKKNNTTVTTEKSSADADIATEIPSELDSVRQPKMTDKENQENTADKKSRLDPKTFYDYLMKSSMNSLYNFTLPEYRPGSFFRYDGTYPRKPVMDMAYTRPPPFFKVRITTRTPVVETTTMIPTTFESKRTSIRVSSTFYPNRIQDVTMRFGNVNDPPTTLPGPTDKEGEADESEFRDAVEPGFTMEKLAYLLIGTCCGLSILCLCVVVIAIKCRRALVEKRMKTQFQRRLYQHERMKDSPWQQQMFDHFLYLHGQPDNQSRSSANSCSCQCVTWSLGARNLEASRPLCPSNSRSSLYLCGQKKLPFGAASTLRFESMLNRKSPNPGHGCRDESHNSDSSHENDSLEQGSESRTSTGSRHCTCINYSMWPMPGDVRRGMYGLCPTGGPYVAGDCTHHSPEDMGVMPRNCPPPVTGSNYLDRSEGVVYWSSNDERLI